MTVKKLHQDIIQCKKYDHHKFKLSHATAWILSSLKFLESARSFHINPKVPIGEALEYIMARHKVLASYKNIRPLYVFDAQNPMKETTNDNWNSKVAQALARLNNSSQVRRVPLVFLSVRKWMICF